MRLGDFKFEIAPQSAEQDNYDVLIEDDSGTGTEGNYFEIDEVRWQHNEKRVYLKMGGLTNEQPD